MRNLDITTLRSFMAVADLGGVTKAAGFLNLTQSAVSMQLKRLEEMLGLSLLDRTGRTIALTPEGEQLLGYARRMVALNDEVVRRLSHQEFEGDVLLGVPHDIVYPVIPQVLKQLRALYPRIRVQLVASNTRKLKEQFSKGELDLILTTESIRDGEELCRMSLAWIGAAGGATWRRRPLRFASSRDCLFRSLALGGLDTAGIEWENALDTVSDRSVEVTVVADMAVTVMLEQSRPPHMEVIDHGGALPPLGEQHINMYGADTNRGEVVEYLAECLRQGFAKAGHTSETDVARRLIAI